MNEKEFMRERQAAVERMKEMNSRSQNPKSSSPPKTAASKTSDKQSNSFNLPFLDMISQDGDSTLIIGLLLILMSEKADKMLLFALVYILI